MVPFQESAEGIKSVFKTRVEFPTGINPFGTIGLTTAISFLLDSPVLLALLYTGRPP